VLKEVLACECGQCQSHEGKTCGRNFRINPPELAFYMKQGLALAHKCPDCRHNARQRVKNPLKLRADKCHNCQKEIQTTVPAGRGLRIYCEKCYEKEIY
jgi:hypothetical protein